MSSESKGFYEIGKEVAKGFSEGIKVVEKVDIGKLFSISEERLAELKKKYTEGEG